MLSRIIKSSDKSQSGSGNWGLVMAGLLGFGLLCFALGALKGANEALIRAGGNSLLVGKQRLAGGEENASGRARKAAARQLEIDYPGAKLADFKVLQNGAKICLNAQVSPPLAFLPKVIWPQSLGYSHCTGYFHTELAVIFDSGPGGAGSGLKLEAQKQVLNLAESLLYEDRQNFSSLALIFAAGGSPGSELPLTRDKAAIKSALANDPLYSAQGTSVLLAQAYELLRPGGRSRLAGYDKVIRKVALLVTCGGELDFAGFEHTLLGLGQKFRQAGIEIFVLRLGDNDEIAMRALEVLASSTPGSADHYFSAANVQDLEKDFISLKRLLGLGQADLG